MTDVQTVQTTFFPGVVRGGTNPSGVLFVDADILIKFEKIGKLDTLFAANRVVIITPEVRREAVDDAQRSSDPDVRLSGQRIGQWIDSNRPGSNSASGVVEVTASDPNRPVFTGTDSGEQSILADVAFLNGQDDPVILSDNTDDIGLTSQPGSAKPVLTGYYFLNSLLLGGGITPNDYFDQIGKGKTAGFAPAPFVGGSTPDSKATYDSGHEYNLTLGGVRKGTVQFNTVGDSSIIVDGQEPIRIAPYEKGGIGGDLTAFKVSDLGDGSQIVQVYDVFNFYLWSQQTTAIDPQRRVTSVDTLNDDATRQLQYWDVQNTQPWSYQTQQFNSQGQTSGYSCATGARPNTPGTRKISFRGPLRK
jgi:hypothetical protein